LILMISTMSHYIVTIATLIGILLLNWRTAICFFLCLYQVLLSLFFQDLSISNLSLLLSSILIIIGLEVMIFIIHVFNGLIILWIYFNFKYFFHLIFKFASNIYLITVFFTHIMCILRIWIIVIQIISGSLFLILTSYRRIPIFVFFLIIILRIYCSLIW
jgi:hypothetical protein